MREGRNLTESFPQPSKAGRKSVGKKALRRQRREITALSYTLSIKYKGVDLKMADLLRFTVPGKPEYVGVVRLAVSSAANTAGFDVEDIEDIKIAVSEVCTNVFCKCENTLTYQIVCELGDDGIIISIDDGGMYGEKGGEQSCRSCGRSAHAQSSHGRSRYFFGGAGEKYADQDD